jgi:hypothetical protein
MSDSDKQREAWEAFHEAIGYLYGAETRPSHLQEHEADKPLSWWAERLETSSVFGGWVNSSRVVGVAGLRVQDAVKTAA